MDLNASNFKGERKSLRLENLIRDPNLQGRADPSVVKKFTADVAEAVAAGHDIDPIFVIHITKEDTKPDGKKVAPGYYVVDGFRRSGGYEAAGRATIPAVVRVGTWTDAMDVATSANANNVALVRTREDKERQLVLSFANHPDRSARWHAEHCRVSRDLTAKKWAAFEKTLDPEVLAKIKAEGKTDKRGTKRAATGKKKAKSQAATTQDKAADWKGYESAFNWITRFIDHLSELDGKKTTSEKAHKQRITLGETMLAWKESLKKAAEEAAERAKAEAKTAAETKKGAEAKKGDQHPFEKEDESGKGKEG